MQRLSDQAAGLRVVKDDSKDEGRTKINFHRGDGGPLTIAVTSGKGGVGKTQVSANVGVALAKQGELSVLLLDADLGLASLDLALGLQPVNDLRSVLSGQCKIEDILIEGPCGVKLIPACPGRYEMANIGTKERRALIEAVEEVAEGFDVLVIDTGAGIGSNAVDFAAYADEVFLVCTPDPTSLRDAYAMAKVLHRRAGLDRIQVVANQVVNDAEGAALYDRIDGIVRRFLTLEMKYLGSIPRDEKVREAVSSGTPFVLGAASGVAARAIETIVRRLLPLPSTPRQMC